MPDKYPTLGELESLVLLAVLRLEGHAYGVPIREEIQRRAKRSLTLGAIYKTLMRLEGKGLLASAESQPESRRGGRRRKLYHLTPAGKHALEDMLTTINRMAQGLSVAVTTR
jgi:PadR family transcriptional regulator PadR